MKNENDELKFTSVDVKLPIQLRSKPVKHILEKGKKYQQ